jgi:hypothetical protein
LGRSNRFSTLYVASRIPASPAVCVRKLSSGREGLSTAAKRERGR